MHQNRLFVTRADALSAARGDLSIVLCLSCGFVFNRSFDADLLDYSSNYDNAQHHSPEFTGHLHAMRNRIATGIRREPTRLLEIGCGQGDFLLELVATGGPGVNAIGYDPAFQGAPDALDGRIRFISDYFVESPGRMSADLVFSRHVIEHIARPIPFLKSAANVLDGQPEGRMFLETPCVEWIVANRVWWDLFYEHCSYWSPHSLAYALDRAGLRFVEVERVFGGQYLWVEAATGAGKSCVEKPPDEFVDAFRELGLRSASDIDALREVISERSRAGAVALWGAGAKGATCAVLIDPRAEIVNCVVDINENKQGKFIGGSGHPIVGPQEISARGITDVLVMNPKYLSEVAAICEDVSDGVRVVALEQEVAI